MYQVSCPLSVAYFILKHLSRYEAVCLISLPVLKMQVNPRTSSEEELCSVYTATFLRQCISFGSLQMTAVIVFLLGSPCVSVRLFVTND